MPARTLPPNHTTATESGAPAFDASRVALEVDALADLAASLAPAAHGILTTLAKRLREPRLSIAFMGRFSSGKSSLINCALTRPLLPVSDIAETGVVCAIRKGPKDRLIVRRANGACLEAPCSPQTLSRFISLRTESGPSNAELLDVEGIDVELEGFREGGTVWLDTPGVDNGEESRRSDKVRELADVVIWTLNSTAFLSEEEMAAIADQVSRSGREAVILVANVFLKPNLDRDAAWQVTLTDDLPRWQARLFDQTADAGLAAWSPRLLAVSAAAAGADPTGFGCPELCALLAQFDDAATAAWVRHARAAHELAGALSEIQAACSQLSVQNEERREALRQRSDADRKSRAAVRRRATDTVEQFRRRFADVACRAGEEVASQVRAPIRRDDSYAQLLGAHLGSAAETARAELVGGLAGPDPASAAAVASIASALANHFTVTLPRTPSVFLFDRRGAFFVGLIGLVLGLLLGQGDIAAALVLAALGGGIGGVWGGRGPSKRREIELTQAAIIAACGAAAEQVAAASTPALPLLVNSMSVEPPRPPSPDDQSEATLNDLATRSQTLIDALGAGR